MHMACWCRLHVTFHPAAPAVHTEWRLWRVALPSLG